MSVVVAVIMGIVFCVVFAVMVFILQYIVLFHKRHCRHCNHVMEYRGEKTHDDKNLYIFECPNCGTSEEVPTRELMNSLNLTL